MARLSTENYLNREVWKRITGSLDDINNVKHRNGDYLDCRRENLRGTNTKQERLAPKKVVRVAAVELPQSIKPTDHHHCPTISGLRIGISYRVCALRAHWKLGVWKARCWECELCPIGQAAIKKWPEIVRPYYLREPETDYTLSGIGDSR
jgi:hypothetical protein